MKIIVCGAGSVGKSIVGYLLKGNNDIIVVDKNQHNLDSMAKEFDIQPLLGEASHPYILERAGAKNADMLIAVTDVDEVNMVACQVAHSLFNIPRKIARIDSEEYLEPLWATLYNENQMPIDLIISPEIAIGEAIFNILKIPGTSEVLPLLNHKLTVLAFKCDENCPLLDVPLMQYSRVIPDLQLSFVSIVRKGHNFIPKENDRLMAGDTVYLLVEEENIPSVIVEFGMEHTANERIIIFGGNRIARYLGHEIEREDNVMSCKVIEENYESAKQLARELSHIVVINGPMMSDIILNEADIKNTDATVAVTAEDKDNILASILARKCGVPSTISLVNSPSYKSLVDNIGDNLLVDRSAVTISAILKEIRKTHLSQAYALGQGFGEVWEVVIDENSPVLERKIILLGLPDTLKICAIYREGKIIFADSQEYIKLGDKLILYVDSTAIRHAEKIFS